MPKDAPHSGLSQNGMMLAFLSILHLVATRLAYLVQYVGPSGFLSSLGQSRSNYLISLDTAFGVSDPPNPLCQALGGLFGGIGLLQVVVSKG